MVIETKKGTDFLLNWAPSHHGYEDRKKYFGLLRSMLAELALCGNKQTDMILKKYNVYFADIDEFPRVNIDVPNNYEI